MKYKEKIKTENKRKGEKKEERRKKKRKAVGKRAENGWKIKRRRRKGNVSQFRELALVSILSHK